MATLRPGALQQDVWDAAVQKHLAAASAMPDAEAATTWVALWHAVHAAVPEPQLETPLLEVFVTRHDPSLRDAVRVSDEHFHLQNRLLALYHCCRSRCGPSAASYTMPGSIAMRLC